jgi:hypothetical protein
LLHLWLQKFVRIMRGTQGALIVASTLQIIMGFSGLWRIVVRLVSCSRPPGVFRSQCTSSDPMCLC